jgi:hypothetical protein
MADLPSLDSVLENIRNPHNWAKPETIFHLICENPSLRGMIYGYASEREFEWHYLKDRKTIEKFSKDDDHKKTKSDRTVLCGGKSVTIQIKSVQTNSIKFENGRFAAKVQNDASDRRKVTLPNGSKLETTCYVVGEYDILAVSLHPFTGEWKYAFKENSQLQRSTSKKYTPKQQKYLLATLETIYFPLDPSWTEDFDGILQTICQRKS